MKKILLTGLAMGLGLIVFAGSAYALSVSYDNSGPFYTTSKVTSFTNGETMAGMEVTATFNDGTSETVTWASDGKNSASGKATTGSGNYKWSLSQSHDPMNQKPWTYKGPTNISNISIDAGPGNTVFDVLCKSIGTPGSSYGQPISWSTFSLPWTVSATYSGQVALSGTHPVGDLYRYLSINFSTYTGNNNNGTFQFVADTDTTVNNINPVPEPATMLLLGTGLAGLAGTMRRRKKDV